MSDNVKKNASAIDPTGKSVVEMPAGHSRDEQLKINADALAEEGEKRFEKAFSIDPAKLEKFEREIASKMTAGTNIPITNKQPGYYYLWVLHRASERLEAVVARVHDMVKAWGYEPVQGDMPEAAEFKRSTDTTRVCGDVMLYRIDAERYHMLGVLREKKQAQKEDAVELSFQQAGDRYFNKLGFNPAHSAKSDPMMDHIPDWNKGAEHKIIVARGDTRALKEGTARFGSTARR